MPKINHLYLVTTDNQLTEVPRSFLDAIYGGVIAPCGAPVTPETLLAELKPSKNGDSALFHGCTSRLYKPAPITEPFWFRNVFGQEAETYLRGYTLRGYLIGKLMGMVTLSDLKRQSAKQHGWADLPYYWGNQPARHIVNVDTLEEAKGLGTYVPRVNEDGSISYKI